MAQSLTRTFVLFACAGAMQAAAAVTAPELLPDPTRPPASIASETTDAPRRPVLQSIIIKGNSRAAIIDGERVELHGKFREARVARITESEVVLRSASGVETLKMYPDVEKTVKRAEAPRAGVERRRGGVPGEKR